jgi:TldD protein
VSASLVAVQEVVLDRHQRRAAGRRTRPLVRFNVSVLVEQNGRREQGYAGRRGVSRSPSMSDEPAGARARGARQALVNRGARPAPAGTMTVVLGPGWPGILLHEAIGHGLEGDFNRKGTSAFANCIGEQVAPGVHGGR